MNTSNLAKNKNYFAPQLPEGKSQRRKVLKDQARLLHQARGWGAPSIKKEFDSAFGKEMSWGERTVSDWIGEPSSDRTSTEYWQPWKSSHKTDNLSYLLRLDLVKRCWPVDILLWRGLEHFGKGLTKTEAEIATKLELSLLGLDESIVILIIHEYSQRLNADKIAFTADLDLLITTRPWQGSKLYDHSLREGIAPPVEIRGLNTDESWPTGERNPLVNFQIWSWDTLKVPWSMTVEHENLEVGRQSLRRLKKNGLSDQQNLDLDIARKSMNWEWMAINNGEPEDEYFRLLKEVGTSTNKNANLEGNDESE